jgi:hypothetical protein
VQKIHVQPCTGALSCRAPCEAASSRYVVAAHARALVALVTIVRSRARGGAPHRTRVRVSIYMPQNLATRSGAADSNFALRTPPIEYGGMIRIWRAVTVERKVGDIALNCSPSVASGMLHMLSPSTA